MLRSGNKAGAPNAKPACYHQHGRSGGMSSVLKVVAYVVDQDVNRVEFVDDGLDHFIDRAIIAHTRCLIHASTSGGSVV